MKGLCRELASRQAYRATLQCREAVLVLGGAHDDDLSDWHIFGESDGLVPWLWLGRGMPAQVSVDTRRCNSELAAPEMKENWLSMACTVTELADLGLTLVHAR